MKQKTTWFESDWIAGGRRRRMYFGGHRSGCQQWLKSCMVRRARREAAKEIRREVSAVSVLPPPR